MRQAIFVKVFQRVVGIADSLIAFGPHGKKAPAGHGVALVVIFAEVGSECVGAFEVLRKYFGHAPYHIHAVEGAFGHVAIDSVDGIFKAFGRFELVVLNLFAFRPYVREKSSQELAVRAGDRK